MLTVCVNAFIEELIVHTVTYRAYSIVGTDIHIKMFDDHIAELYNGTTSTNNCGGY